MVFSSAIPVTSMLAAHDLETGSRSVYVLLNLLLYRAVLQQPSEESARSGANVPTGVAPTENRLGAKLAGISERDHLLSLPIPFLSLVSLSAMSLRSMLPLSFARLACLAAAQDTSIINPTTAAPGVTPLPSAHGYTYAGCWNETLDVPNSGGERALSDMARNGADANRLGYCGQYLSALSEEINATAHCVYSCNGNSSELCGGRLALTLYNLTDASKTGNAWSMGSSQPACTRGTTAPIPIDCPLTISNTNKVMTPLWASASCKGSLNSLSRGRFLSFLGFDLAIRAVFDPQLSLFALDPFAYPTLIVSTGQSLGTLFRDLAFGF
ncbi:hypothetical protein KC345_g108 [Hortaea werneckii]|nr:hypothetical protein KC345_g108 [Hortaea werneckii]